MSRVAERDNAYHRNLKASRRAAYFDGKVCATCGSDQELQLDHIDAQSKVSNSIWDWSASRREHELAKCQPLCRACHLVKTKLNHEYRHGSAHADAVLTEDDVREAREAHARGGITYRSLAHDYGVDPSTIRNAIVGKTWKHV